MAAGFFVFSIELDMPEAVSIAELSVFESVFKASEAGRRWNTKI